MGAALFEIQRLLLGPAMELVQAGKGKRGSEGGNSTFSRYFNASGMGKFPDRGPTATAPLRSFCRDATAAQRPLPRLIPSPSANPKFCAGYLTSAHPPC